MKARRPNTPGLLGYVLAVLVSFAVFGVLVGGFAAIWSDGVGQALVIVVLCSLFAAMTAATYGSPVALVGAVLVAVLLRACEPQWVHVLAAGVVGLVLTPAYLALVGGADAIDTLLAPAVGLAAAAGRLAVVPLVRARRREMSDRMLWIPDPRGGGSS